MGTLRSTIIQRAFRAAERLLGVGRVGALLSTAAAVAMKRGVKPIRSDLKAALRMVRETVSGRYRALPKRSVVAILAGAIYLVNPLDLVADVLPVLGLVDDVAVLAWITHMIRRDLDAFLDWEREWGDVIDVEATPASNDCLAPGPPTQE